MDDKNRVLILYTGNSARSQMTEGSLRHDAEEKFTVESARTKPGMVRPEAMAVMKELGIDISGHRSKHVDEFDGQQFDYVITVCDKAKESRPLFMGAVKRLHQSFDDLPPITEKPKYERMEIVRRVRDELRLYLREVATFTAFPRGISAAVFADTFYWVALIHREDAGNKAALQWSREAASVQLVTTEEVLAFCSSDEGLCADAVRIVRSILAARTVRVIPQSHESFLTGLPSMKPGPIKRTA